MMIGLMEECKLSVEGLKVSDGDTIDADTKKSSRLRIINNGQLEVSLS